MKSKRKGEALPKAALETMSRRTVLDWLGKATVLALGSEVLAACGAVQHDGEVDSGLAEDADIGPADDVGSDSASDSGGDVLDDSDTSTPAESWAFRPPEPPPEVYATWPVRTVDRQELESILASWQLRVDGLVDAPVTLGFADLLELQRQDQVTDFHCVEGWSVLDVPWNGVHLATLFELVGPQESATHVTFHTIDSRYNESLPLDVALEPRTLLAYGVDGYTLPLDHGFPVRLVVPRLYAYKSAKYVQRVELTDSPVEGYWVRAGYPYLGEVPVTRLRPGRY